MRAIMAGLALLLASGPVKAGDAAQLGPRPFYLVDQLKPGPQQPKSTSRNVT